MIDSEDKRPEPESLLAIAKKGETARDIAVLLFTGKTGQPIPKKKISTVSLLIYVMSAIGVIIASLLGFIFGDILGQVNLLFLMIIPVVLIATFWGRGPSILAAILSVMIFDFLFVKPYFTFDVSEVGYFTSYLLFIMFAYVISNFVSDLYHKCSSLSKARPEIQLYMN